MEVQVTLLESTLSAGGHLRGVIDVRVEAGGKFEQSAQVQKVPLLTPNGGGTPTTNLVPCVGTLQLSLQGKCLLDNRKFSAPKGFKVETQGKALSFYLTDAIGLDLALPLVRISGSPDRPDKKLLNHKFLFNAKLPENLLPSYVGTFVKVVYLVTIAVKDSKGTVVEDIKVPFTVLPPVDSSVELKLPSAPIVCKIDAEQEEDDEDAERPESKEDKLYLFSIPPVPDSDLESEEDLGNTDDEKNDGGFDNDSTEGSEPRSMVVSNGSAVIGKIVVTKSKYRCGEIIRGVIDFSKSSLLCYRLSVTLERVEEIGESGKSSSVSKEQIKVLGYSHFYTANSENVAFEFSLPDPRFSPSSLAIPSLETNFCMLYFASPFSLCRLVSLKWYLRFKFIADKAREDDEKDSENEGFAYDRSPVPNVGSSEVDVLECTVPLVVEFNQRDLNMSHPNQLIKSRIFRVS
jgi:hypothetical protein